MILLEGMKGATAHTGVEPCVGPKTVVMSFPRVVVIGLLALAKTASRFAAQRRYLFGWDQPPGKLDLVTVISI